MDQFLPLFPLSLVVYPGERLRLHIFEPRYRQLVQECIDDGTTFGIPAVLESTVAGIATEVRLASLHRTYDTGEMDIAVEGLQRVRIDMFHRVSPNKLYPGGSVKWLNNIDNPELDVQDETFALIQELYKMLGMKRELVEDPAELRAYQVAHHIGFNTQQEFEVLTFDQERDRLRYIRTHLRKVVPVVEETERLKARAKLNGHFKNVLPPTY